MVADHGETFLGEGALGFEDVVEILCEQPSVSSSKREVLIMDEA